MSTRMSTFREVPAGSLTSRPAFTLVELLIIVGIIATLVAIALPSLGRAEQIARRVRCATNLKAVAVGFRMYLDDSNDVMPFAAAMPSLQLSDEPRIADVLANYLDNPQVLQCPADTTRRYYESEGSSRKVGEGFMSERFGEGKTPVMYDYEPFHGPAGESGSANYLFANMNVGDLK